MHIPVLLNETIEYLQIKEGAVIVDATLGGGGFSKEVCQRYTGKVTLIGLDADSDAVLRTKEGLRDLNCNFFLETANFADLADVLERLGFGQINGATFDLGLSSYQIEGSNRGFSFQRDEPLQMTFSKEPESEEITASEIINQWSEGSLRAIISAYGEERYAGRISKAIIEARKEGSIKTTLELVDVINKAVPKGYKHGRIHPATRTFQAIRMAVNDEITALERGMQGCFEKLSQGGRIAIISFHSLEDRVIKNFFLKKEKEKVAFRVNKKPIRPDREEVLRNRRSRGAKLRVLEKL
ncbi:MAG: 16S rRNA (cytosine(1402)-N(4))-methyltransferase RsmH [Candidatus Paceibacterota bacterium]